jgi:putative spermidine/putrescine transport system ATP-binding protein
VTVLERTAPVAVSAPPRGHALLLDGVTHRFGAMLAVDGVTLEIGAGELVALLGPSGCGKTTLLRCIAGFIRQTRGRVVIDDKAIDDQPPNRRGIGIVFQNYALFPHMSVADNVAYGLAARGWRRADQVLRVAEMLRLVQMDHLAERFPKQLSGGQQQRIALARALAPSPDILLLDEPFGALDKNLRLDMQIEVKRLQRQFGITAILVTHDQEEALSMADRIAVLSKGRLEQFGTPGEVYDQPASLFVNTFVGSANVFNGRVRRQSGAEVEIMLGSGAALLGRMTKPSPLAPGTPVAACIRPENLRIAEAPGPFRLAGDIELVLPLGPVIVYEIRTAEAGTVKVTEPRGAGGAARPVGARVHLEAATQAACCIFAKSA